MKGNNSGPGTKEYLVSVKDDSVAFREVYTQ